MSEARETPGTGTTADGGALGRPATAGYTAGREATVYYQSERVTLYHGDCLDVLATLDRSAVDAVISDPPYGIGHKPGGGKAVKGRQSLRRNLDTVEGDDEPFNPAPWLDFPRVALWGAEHYRQRLTRPGPFHAWDKTGGGYGPDDSFSDVEFLYSSEPGAAEILHYLWKGVCQAGEKGERRYHPTQKPVRVMAWAMERAKVPEGGLVLDPYAGAGSTGLAALATGRRFIGIELREKWLDAAAYRIEKVERQHSLFPAV